MRFGMRTLLGACTLCAILCAILFALPLVVEIPLLALIVLVTPSIWICGLCYARGSWRAFFLGGIVAGWFPHLCLAYFGLMLMGEFEDLLSDAPDGEDALFLRLMVAGCFLAPGLVAGLGGCCGAIVYRCFAPQELKPSPESRLSEPYVLIESRVTPLTPPAEARSTPS